jgi:hypothetical protein
MTDSLVVVRLAARRAGFGFAGQGGDCFSVTARLGMAWGRASACPMSHEAAPRETPSPARKFLPAAKGPRPAGRSTARQAIEGNGTAGADPNRERRLRCCPCARSISEQAKARANRETDSGLACMRGSQSLPNGGERPTSQRKPIEPVLVARMLRGDRRHARLRAQRGELSPTSEGLNAATRFSLGKAQCRCAYSPRP